MNNSQEKSRFSLIITSAKMAGATLISRFLGLFREQLIASYFGASGLTDTFYVAYRIPNLLRDLFAEGAFSSAFIPVFTEEKNKNEGLSEQLFLRVFWTLSLITGLVSLATFYFSPELVALFAPSFKSQPELFNTTVSMVKIVSPFLFFISIAALSMGVLNTYKIFFIPALMPAVGNVTVICSIIFLTSKLEQWGYPIIFAPAIGVSLGAVLQALFQVPFIKKQGHNFFPIKIQLSPPLKKVFKKMGPSLIGFSIGQLNLLISTILATGAGVGAVSWLSFGYRLFQFPNGIISVSLGNSNLVHFSSLWKKNEFKKATQAYLSSFKIMIFLIIPITLFTLVFSDWLINIVFERGLFTRKDTLQSSTALFYYAMSLPLFGLYKISLPVFYVLDREKIPVIASVIGILTNILIAYFFIDEVGFKVLAIASTISIFINCIIQISFLKGILNFKFSTIFGKFLFKTLIASSTAAAITYLIKLKVQYFDSHFLSKVASISLCCLIFFIIYLFLIAILGEKERVLSVLKKLKLK